MLGDFTLHAQDWVEDEKMTSCSLQRKNHGTYNLFIYIYIYTVCMYTARQTARFSPGIEIVFVHIITLRVLNLSV